MRKRRSVGGTRDLNASGTCHRALYYSTYIIALSILVCTSWRASNYSAADCMHMYVRRVPFSHEPMWPGPSYPVIFWTAVVARLVES